MLSSIIRKVNRPVCHPYGKAVMHAMHNVVGILMGIYYYYMLSLHTTLN